MHITKNKTTRILFSPLIRVCEWLGEHYPVLLIRVRYFARFRKFAHLKNPRDLNEKILYLKLFSDTTVWTMMADKYRVRDYVKKCGLEDTLIPLIGVWNSVEEIDFDKLPSSLIFKANNGCWPGSTLVINDMGKANRNDLKKIFQSWLDQKHIGSLAAEPHYKRIKPCIIAEQLLPIEDGHISLVDYKIWCFNGKVHYIWTCSDRDDKGTNVMTYSREWVPMPEVCIFEKNYRKGDVVDKPRNLDRMIFVAETLAKDLPCVRVDLYNVNNHVYFGEMTFTSLGGMMDFYTEDFLMKCGNIVDLSNVKIK